MARVEPLTESAQWQAIGRSPGRTIVFKHSSTCPISAAAHDRFLAWVDAGGAGDVPVYEVLVIEDRPLSQAIAAETGVEHQSPQALLLEDGRALWHASHWAITKETLDAALHDPARTASHSTTLVQAQAEHKAQLAAMEAGA